MKNNNMKKYAKKNAEPLVNVIIPIYKADKNQLIDAINSIRNQTYSNIKIIAIIDEESGSSINVLTSMKDDRIVIIKNEKNMGLTYSLNRGIDVADGKYIFRMDADDISKPNRIRKQVEYMEKHLDIDVISSFAETFGEYSITYKSSSKNDKIMAELICKNPIIHPTVGFRTKTLKEKNIRYTEGPSEDYRMWIDMSFIYGCKFYVIPNKLIKYRIHRGQVTQVDKNEINDNDKILAKKICQLTNIELTQDEFDIFCKCRQGIRLNKFEIKVHRKTIKKIIRTAPKNISKPHLRFVLIKGLIKSIFN